MVNVDTVSELASMAMFLASGITLIYNFGELGKKEHFMNEHLIHSNHHCHIGHILLVTYG